MGTLLFCLAIHPMVLKLQLELRVFYLDDEPLVVTCRMYYDLLVEEEAADLGLQFNCSKSELLCEDPSMRDQMLQAVPGLQVTDLGQAKILGSPVGSTKSVNDIIGEKIRLLRLLGERLCLLQSQDALLLFRHFFT